MNSLTLCLPQPKKQLMFRPSLSLNCLQDKLITNITVPEDATVPQLHFPQSLVPPAQTQEAQERRIVNSLQIDTWFFPIRSFCVVNVRRGSDGDDTPARVSLPPSAASPGTRQWRTTNFFHSFSLLTELDGCHGRQQVFLNVLVLPSSLLVAILIPENYF